MVQIMYQVNTTKRYNVHISVGGRSVYHFKNVKLIAVERCLVIFEEDDGKEHIFTGGETNIRISEV